MTRLGVLGLLAMALASCNAYNPSGKDDPSDNDAWIAQGEAQLRESEFGEAQESFGHVLANDSDDVRAWSGYAKALSGQHLDIGALLRELLAAERENRKPLWTMPISGKNTLYQGVIPVLGFLDRWARRDSLHGTGMEADRIRERGFLTLAYAMFVLWDSNKDGRISLPQDTVAVAVFTKLLTNLPGGGFIPNFTATPNLFNDASGRPDTGRVGQFNRLLARVDSQFRTVEAIAGTDTAMAAIFASTSKQNPAMLNTYNIGDGIDNDLDGLVDEEVMDGLDNDGDRLVDEDSRPGYIGSKPTPGLPAQTSPSDGIRWDRSTSPWSNKGMPGRDSSITLTYATTAEHNDTKDWPKLILKPFLPMNWAQDLTVRNRAWFWNIVCDWPADSAKKWGLPPECKDKAPFDYDGLFRSAIRRTMENQPLPRTRTDTLVAFRRVQLGCTLVGGAWCRTRDLVCNPKTKSCPCTPATGCNL